MDRTIESYLRACLYETDWQVLRVSLLGKWHDLDGIIENRKRADNYVRGVTIPLKEEYRRVWRVLNLLNAVLLSFKKMDRKKGEYQLVVEWRDNYSKRAKEIQVDFSDCIWDWKLQETKLFNLYKKNPEMFKALLQNLKERVKTANYKEKRGIGGMSHRVELQTYLDLMARVHNSLEMKSL